MANGRLGFRDRFGNFWINHRRKVLAGTAVAALGGAGYATYNHFSRPDKTEVTVKQEIDTTEKADTNKKAAGVKREFAYSGASQGERPVISLEGEVRCYREDERGAVLRELRMNPRLSAEEEREASLSYDDLVLRPDTVYRCSVSNRNEWIGHNFSIKNGRHFVTMEAVMADGEDGIYPVRSFDLGKEAAGFKVGDEEGKYGSVRFAVGRLHPGVYRANIPLFGNVADPKTGEGSDRYIGTGVVNFKVGDAIQETARDTSEERGRVIIGERRKARFETELSGFGRDWGDSNL